jgi:2-dehydro-3-deoxyphosphogluconate aldolase/(4S)-4-hydroxy-2-oxoglutarate aldolase
MSIAKSKSIEALQQSRIVPLYSTEDFQEAEAIVRAAYEAGVRVFEFTNRKPNSLHVFQHLVEVTKTWDDFFLGIGTIMDGATTEKFIEAGADFIISPIVKIEMANVCLQHNVPWIPGCATLTEIITAHEAGASAIKIFPGAVLGPSFISSIRPVVPDLNLMITGGVEPTQENLSAWFKAGATCVGLGSQLFSKKLVDAKDWEGIKQKIEFAMNIVQRL